MKKVLMALVALAVGLAVALVLGEIATRVMAPSWLQHRMAYLNPATADAVFAGDRDWKVEKTPDGEFLRFVPGSSFVMQHLEYNLAARIDEEGGRRGAMVSSDQPVVPFLGDSFTFGVGVADEETFVSLAGVRLQRALLNLGVPGSTLTDHLRIAKARAEELKRPPVWVFCVFCGNDLNDLLHRVKDEPTPERVAPAQPLEQLEVRAVATPTHRGLLWEVNSMVSDNPVLRRSYLVQLVRNGLLRAVNRSGEMPRQDPAFLMMDPGQTDLRRRLTELWNQALDDLQEQQDELGFQSLFVVIPDRYQVNGPLREMQAAYYGIDPGMLDPDWATKTVTAGLAKRGIPYLDLTDALHGGDGLFYVQDNHLTSEGHRQAAEAIVPWLQRFIGTPGQSR